MSGNRRQFLGAGAVALAAAGVGLAWAKMQSNVLFQPALASEGNLPSFDGATTWLSSAPLSSAELRGKVVAIQFWTYTCVNWMRTLPYVRAWADKYRESGLVVVGVHTPEFSFEHKVDNVQQAARVLQVEYPIAVDNEHAVWDAFANQYWQPCISPMRADVSDITISAMAATTSRSKSFNNSWLTLEQLVSILNSSAWIRAAEKWPPTGPT